MADHPLLSDGLTLYDPERWLSKDDAARVASTTTRTIERWASSGLLSPLYYLPGHKRRIAVYDREQVLEAKRKSLERPVAARREPTPPTSEHNGHVGNALVPVPRREPTRPAVVGVVPIEKKVYLTLAEASEYSGLPVAVLMRLVAEKKIKRFEHRQWFLRRADLEKL